MEKVWINILGPLPLTHQKVKCILVISDVFTKWTEAIPFPDQEATTGTKAFVDTFVGRFGTQLQVYSDQGQNFEAKVFQDMCTYLHIEKNKTIFRPQASWAVEIQQNLDQHAVCISYRPWGLPFKSSDYNTEAFWSGKG